MLDVAIPMILKMRSDLADAKKQLGYDYQWFVTLGTDKSELWASAIQQRLETYTKHQIQVAMLTAYLDMLDKEVTNDQT